MLKSILQKCFLLLLFSSQIIEGMEKSGRDFEKAEKLKDKIFPGRIIADTKDGKYRVDYSSAVVIGLPEATQTKTILSSAHSFVIPRSKDPHCLFYFQDCAGRMLKIDNVTTFSKDLNVIDANNDVAVFRLFEPIPCNPNVEISKDVPLESTLSTLSYGWVLDPDNYFFANTDASKPAYCEGHFSPRTHTFVQQFSADRVVKIYTQQKFERSFYLSKRGSNPQVCLYDSGSPWFTISEDKISLKALTTGASPVSSIDNRTCSMSSRIHNSDFSFLGIDRTCEVYNLKTPSPFEDTLTSLSHLRDRIYRECK